MHNVLPPDDDTKTVKFLLKENLARYKLNNKGKKLKTLIIDDNQYRYNPTKPISNKLKSKLEKKRQTNEYRAYQIKELAATDTVRKFAIRKRATITEEQSAFKAYANAYTISNIHLKGLNGLTYFPYQFERLNEYLEKHKGMKLNAAVKISVVNIYDEMQDVVVRTRSYTIIDSDELQEALNNMRNAMLKLTGIEIDLVYDQEMYEMIEAGLRGGMTQTTCKKVEAYNKYMGSDYDKNKASSYINYLDANNLYGLSMIQKLPYRNLKWDDKITEDDIINYDNGRTGYILDVDLEYPKELHDLHNDYPLAPEVMNVKANMLSEKQVEIYKLINGSKEPKDEKTNKLILNLNDKNKYVVHIRTLQFYLKHGLKLKKVHRAIQFEQKEIFKPYIESNTEKRKNARNDFEKDIFKLLNNAVFGKTMEDKRKHLDFEIVSDERRFMKCVNNPSFKHSHIINENLVGVEKQKPKLKLDKPIFIGMSILDLSKQHMYKFYYDVMKPKYGDNIRMVYTDTDSFVFHTRTDDIYQDLQEINDEMDFSGYDKNHKCYDATNKKVLGWVNSRMKWVEK